MPHTGAPGIGAIRVYAKISFGAILATMIGLHSAQAQSQASNNPLVGTWRLASFSNKDANGNPTQPWGAKPAGVFMFAPDGNFSEIIVNEEKANTSIDYFGTYSVEDGKVLRLHIVGTSAPQFRGRDLQRQITLSGDQFSYTNTNPSVGGTSALSWERVK